MAKRLRIEQVRSGCNAPQDQRRTLRALGLRRHQAVVEKEDHPAIRGMIRKVAHLLRVEEIE